MPAGSSLTLRFTYPHARYFQFALYKAERNTFVSTGEALAGQDIEPAPGCANPFRVGANRLAEPRNFTLRILAEAPPPDPKQRARNTLYAWEGRRRARGRDPPLPLRSRQRQHGMGPGVIAVRRPWAADLLGDARRPHEAHGGGRGQEVRETHHRCH
jgi:hypothetical protein